MPDHWFQIHGCSSSFHTSISSSPCRWAMKAFVDAIRIEPILASGKKCYIINLYFTVTEATQKRNNSWTDLGFLSKSSSKEWPNLIFVISISNPSRNISNNISTSWIPFNISCVWMLGSLETVISSIVGIDRGIQEHQRTRIGSKLFLKIMCKAHHQLYFLENYETYLLQVVKLSQDTVATSWWPENAINWSQFWDSDHQSDLTL